MVVTLGPELEAALKEQAKRHGIAPEVLALNALRERFLSNGLASPTAQARAAFQRDLPELLKDHAGLWVAYQGEHRLGFAASKWELHQQCLARGLNPSQFVVCCVEPEMHEIVVGPGLAAEFE